MTKLFISYRREDSEGLTGRIYDRLVAHFGKEEVFIDVDTIPFGVDFVDHLSAAVSQCDILLAMIGEQWLDVCHKEGPHQGQRRLDDTSDFVRIEIQAALERNIPVIPVLIGKTAMPGQEQLPNELKKLARRNAAEVRFGRDFHNHVDRLIQGIEHLLQTMQKAGDAGQVCSRANKTQPKSGDIITNSLGMKFAWIPPGTFLMGSPKTEAERSDNEAQHKVTLSMGFNMGVHLVTQEQWQAVMGNNPSNFKGEKNLPVEQASWEDCQEFIKKLGDKDKKAYRLPTEAEWEYACRAGTKTPFWFGETISTDQANYDGNHIYGNGKKGVYRQKTTPVGSFPANAWGLHDTHGNLSEWCQDWFGVYPQNDVVDPQGRDAGQYRVLRGGAWINDPWDCRSASRLGNAPGFRDCYYGLRVCFCLD